MKLLVAEQRRKLASYEVAGNIGNKISVPDGTVETMKHIMVPASLQDAKAKIRLPGTMCRANFRRRSATLKLLRIFRGCD